VISTGKFQGTITPTTPTGSFHTHGVGGRQLAPPRERVDHRRRPGQRLAHGHVELRAVGEQHRGADLGDQLGPQLLLLGLEGGLQLRETRLPQVGVGGPCPCVRSPAGGGDGAGHVGVRPVGHDPHLAAGGRVDDREGGTGLGVDELPVDEHAGLVRHGVETDAYQTSGRCSIWRRPGEYSSSVPGASS
jgi:hypothetical protein